MGWLYSPWGHKESHMTEWLSLYVTSFSSYLPLQGSISKYSHVVSCCGLGLQYMNVGDTIWFITHTDKISFEF